MCKTNIFFIKYKKNTSFFIVYNAKIELLCIRKLIFL